jgi:hypothetical protein
VFYIWNKISIMIKKYIILLFVLNSSISLLAQERCGYKKVLEYNEMKYPGYKNAVNSAFNSILNLTNERATQDSFYTIQVVVHVVYKTAAQNLPDSVIFNQIDILNKDYSRMNSDTINLRAEFFPIRAKDSRIRFELASVDPQGNPTNGIVRKLTTKTSFFNLLGGGIAEEVKSSSTDGSDPWNQSKYLNIWVCNMDFLGTPFILGYATPPSGLPNWDSTATSGLADGVVIQYEFFGSNNPTATGLGSYIVKGRTVTHEVGHYLGLRHIWGDGSGNGACDGDDGISDTPSADAASDQNTACNVTTNTCTQPTLNLGDLNDMTENYMDYSGEQCQNSFTNGQAEFMHNVLVTKRKGITKNTTDLKQLNSNYKINIYPNPTTDNITIEFDKNDKNRVVKILDIYGKTLYSSQIQNKLSNISLAEFSNGIYFVQIMNDELLNYTQKVCIKR